LEKDLFLHDLHAVEKRLQDTTKTEQEISELKEEQTMLLDDISEIDKDIAIYQEMMDKLKYCEEEYVGGYDSRYEVFTEGDY
jgi:peptidoglycan hydrolase CwlO-like protein